MGARGRFLVLVTSAVLLSTCAETPRDSAGEQPPADRFGANATVLDDGDGPELCLGDVADSLPPQCSGVPITGWRWGDMDSEETANGVTWGQYHVIGSYDGSTFTVETVGPIVPSEPDGVDPFETPCSEPEGGWTDVDPSTTGEKDRIAAMRAAEAIPEYAGLWIDHLQEPVEYEVPGPYVLNIAFTGDPARFESDIRAVWGGPLCLLSFDRTFRDLRRVQGDLEGAAESIGYEVLSSSVDVIDNEVELGVIVATPAIETALADRYGEGTVRLVPSLRPVGSN